MNTERVKEIQQATAYPNSKSVQQALLQVWHECSQEQIKPMTHTDKQPQTVYVELPESNTGVALIGKSPSTKKPILTWADELPDRYIFTKEELEALKAKWMMEQWISVNDRLPETLETVWISNGKGWTTLGCRSDYHYGDEDKLVWCWAKTNGIIYEEDGKIISECEEDDLDVTHWMPLPQPPKQ